MGEEEKEPQAQPEAAPAEAPAQEVVGEKLSDEELSSLLGDSFGDFGKLASLLPSIPVVVGRDRVAAALAARERHGADLIILDDGFQHRRLHRDADLVTMDAALAVEDEPLLPAGTRREPWPTRAERIGGAGSHVRGGGDRPGIRTFHRRPRRARTNGTQRRGGRRARRLPGRRMRHLPYPTGSSHRHRRRPRNRAPGIDRADSRSREGRSRPCSRR